MKIESSDLTNIAVRTSQYPTDMKDEFLLVGKSNVGKSSFINTILARKNFARTSSKPGKTQTLNFYLVNDKFYLVDVPGYGYANVSKSTQKKFGLMIEEYLTKRDNLKMVFMLSIKKSPYLKKPINNKFTIIAIIKRLFLFFPLSIKTAIK